ncbi:MAG: DNA-binding protein [Lachnospiraceae bacterium]|nr:DNA-binding protein [Lachnospiraceae bacterium]
MEKIVRQSLLYDFYGELLTDHQKNIYEEVVMNDMSYSEIGRIYGISRQGAYDLIKRCDKILEDYETKLKLVEKFVNAREKIATVKSDIIKLKAENKDSNLVKLIDDIEVETAKLLEEF